jgi:uncharacterized membrane protein
MPTGPTQLVVIGFERLERVPDPVLAELRELRRRNLIRLLDLLFIARDEAGRLTTRGLPDLPEPEQGRYGSLLGTLIGQDLARTTPDADRSRLSAEGVRQVAVLLEPGAAAALLLIEHLWAGGLASALDDAGGKLLAQGLLTSDARIVMGEALRVAGSKHLVPVPSER